MNLKKVMDFKVLPLRYSEEDDSHELLIREHSSRNYTEDKPLGRTLFVVNIPPYVDEQSLKRLFSEVGEITSVSLQQGIPGNDSLDNKTCGNGFKSGYIVYKQRESLVKSLNLTFLNPVVDANNQLTSGLCKYAKLYNETICDHAKLFEEATRVVKAYDEKEEKRLREETEVDDEGWTVVKRKGRNPGLALKESVDTKLNEKHKRKMKKKMLQNFYSFQIRESKKKHLATLREQHEEAKKKIAEIKKTRTFKPY